MQPVWACDYCGAHARIKTPVGGYYSPARRRDLYKAHLRTCTKAPAAHWTWICSYCGSHGRAQRGTVAARSKARRLYRRHTHHCHARPQPPPKAKHDPPRPPANKPRRVP